MGPARHGMDEGVDVEGFGTWLNRDNGPLPTRRPDAAQDRLEPHPVLVGRPDIDGHSWLRRAYGRYLLTEVCLNVAWATGSALM